MRTALILLLASSLANAEPVTLRMAGIAPDGVAWVRELKAFARDIEARTHGRVKMKWYWGGIAGDELAVLDRIRRDQLDGEAGVQHCMKVAPSMRVFRLLGLVQSYDEQAYVLGRLHQTLDDEFRKSGFWAFESGMGSELLLSRVPVRSLAELRGLKVWQWDIDEMMGRQMRALGISQLVPTALNDTYAALEAGRFDVIQAIPSAALAFQWSSRAKYYTDLKLGFVPACLMISNRVFDALSVEDQQILQDAGARLEVRFRDLGKTQDKQLTEELFPRQGLEHLVPSQTFRAEFFNAAREARKAVPPEEVAPELVRKVESWLADYRAEHR
jgi:TRAP-type C4-dicarboxylate transport system substrate-binding protein